MMTTQRKWLLVVGVIAAATVALALGVSPSTLLLFGAILLCPAAMFFGMGGMQQGCRHGKEHAHSDAQGAERKPEERDFKRTA